jgi:tRNA modification GTPase
VVLTGPPNVGKSRLFNSLLGRDHAIVSPQPGTTRDYLTALCDCDGLIVELVDTAGIEPAGDRITSQAQAYRAAQAAQADLLLECETAESAGDTTFVDPLASARPGLRVWTKLDQAAPDRVADDSTEMVKTSAATGAGLDDLRCAIARRIRNQAGEGNLPAGTAARCRGSILRAEAALRSAAETLLQAGGDELVAADLHLAIDELGRVVGAVVTEDILDRIFRRFCIGK